MSELIEKLGINWKLFLAQVVNFLIIVAVLRLTVYKPLLKMLRERRERIDKGLRDAEAATKRLGEVEIVGKARLAEVERDAVQVIARAETTAKDREAEILVIAKGKEAEILKGAERLAEAKRIESEAAFFEEAKELVKGAVAKVGNLAPDAIDESLVAEAVRAAKKMKT